MAKSFAELCIDASDRELQVDIVPLDEGSLKIVLRKRTGWFLKYGVVLKSSITESLFPNFELEAKLEELLEEYDKDLEDAAQVAQEQVQRLPSSGVMSFGSPMTFDGSSFRIVNDGDNIAYDESLSSYVWRSQ